MPRDGERQDNAIVYMSTSGYVLPTGRLQALDHLHSSYNIEDL
jgi:hypothetical protein